MKKKISSKKVLLIIAIILFLLISTIIILFPCQYAPGPDDSINGKWRLVQMGTSQEEMKDLPRNFMEMTISDGRFEEISFEKDGSIKTDSTEHGSIKKNLLGEYRRSISEWDDANIIVKALTFSIYRPEEIRKEGADRLIIHLKIAQDNNTYTDRYLRYERIKD